MWYQAFGYTYVNRASVGTPFLFGGKHGYYADGDSGMLLLGRRYYLPSFHRFLTQDPSGHAAGLNLYEYASNNPLTTVDPTGMDDLSKTQRDQVIAAINMIRTSGYVGAKTMADRLTERLNSGHIVVEQADPQSTDAAVTESVFYTNGNNVTINIMDRSFAQTYPARRPLQTFSYDVYLSSVLVHEYQHAFRQGFLWQKFHPNEKEDRAYAAQLHYLQRLRTTYSSPSHVQAINEEMGKFFGD